MEAEKFDNIREFNNKYPSKFYICSHCGKIIPDQYACLYCGWRADGLFKTMDKGYQFIIEGEDIKEIFKPIEREINNAAGNSKSKGELHNVRRQT